MDNSEYIKSLNERSDIVKIVKKVMIILTSVSALLMVGIPLVSSNMQGYYKSLMDTNDISQIQVALDKKQFWVQLGESWIFFYVFLFCVLTLLVICIIMKHQKKS